MRCFTDESSELTFFESFCDAFCLPRDLFKEKPQENQNYPNIPAQNVNVEQIEQPRPNEIIFINEIQA